MRPQFWRRLMAAAVGAVALAGSAAAQQLSPVPRAAADARTVVAQPAIGPTAPTVAPGGVVYPGDTVYAAPRGHGTAARGFVMEASGGYYGTNCSTGQGCNNGCGSLKSDLGFALGNCRSYFAPCGPRPLDCGGFGACGGGRGGCLTPVYGRGPCGPFNPCVYDSYLNH